MTVTVAMPWYGAPELLGRAVASVLAQTHRDLRLIIVADGADCPVAITDSRVEVYRLPENRGCYFGFQLMLEASPDEWHAPIGADDWIEPDHIERMIGCNHDAVAPGSLWFHEARRRPVRLPRVTYNKGGWIVGIFRPERLLRFGGYDPSARVVEDVQLVRLLDLTGGYLVPVSKRPSYHRWKRPGSLTTAPATHIHSAVRDAARERNATILARCWELAPDVAAIRAYRASQVPPRIRDELAEHVERLRARL